MDRGGAQRHDHDRSGDPYKPSCLRGYVAALERRIVPALGEIRLADLRRRDVQKLVDRWLEAGVSPSSARNWLMPLRAICRRAISREDLAVNPTSGLELPAVRGRRERIATPEEAEALLRALPDADRALWATALYAGLRRGELAALRLEEIDFDTNVITVNASWDVVDGRIDVKSAAGRRRVPMPKRLRSELLAHRLRLGRTEGLAFGRTPTEAFRLEVPARRAARTWKDAGLTPIGMHECRHTYASLMIAAGVSSGQGVNMKALSVFMGHASIQITYDRYGHLLPGAEQDAADMLDRLLGARAS
ncbi:MAG: tyrosine-type recombinase/integrase [Gaiellaceae bacterium]